MYCAWSAEGRHAACAQVWKVNSGTFRKTLLFQAVQSEGSRDCVVFVCVF